MPGVAEWLAGVTATPEGRYAVTAAVALVAVGTTLFVRRLGPHLKARYDEVTVEAGQTAVVAATWASAIWALVVIWRATGEVNAALAVLNVSQKQLVLGVVSVAVLVAAYFLTRITRRSVRRLTKNRTAISSHEREIAHHVVQVSVYALAGLVVLSLWDVPVGNLLLGAGFLGVVVGLAARQTLGAMLAGFVVLFSRPFEIGDWVEVGDNEGIVTDITVVNTRLQTFDGEYVMIPNDMVTAEEVVNRSRKGRLRVEVEVGVDYTTDLDRAVPVAREALDDLDPVLSVPQPQVVCKSFDDSAVTLGLRFWIDKPSARRRWRAQTAVVRAVKGAFEEAGIKIPFPQRELSGRAETGGFRMAEAPPEDAPVEAVDGRESVDAADDEAADGETDADEATADGDPDQEADDVPDGDHGGETDDADAGTDDADDGPAGDGATTGSRSDG